MVNFFRKMRKNTLSESSSAKYLKYAIGEIILVVIGILIALQVNNWNEGRKALIKRNEFTRSLLRELKQDTTDFKARHQAITEDFEQFDAYERRLSSNSATIDTMKHIARFEFNPAIDGKNMYNNNTLKALQESGDIQLYPRHVQELMLSLLSQQDYFQGITVLFLKEFQSAFQKMNDLATRPEKNRYFSINEKFKSETWDHLNEVEFITVFDNLINSKITYNKYRIQSDKLLSEKTEELIKTLQSFNQK